MIGSNATHATRSRVIAALFSVSVIAGCVTVTKNTFDLSSTGVTSAREVVNAPHLKRVQILVAAPSALKSLDGQDIVVRGGYGTISYLKDAQWGDRLPNIVQARLAQAFEDTGALGGIGRPGDGLAINYQLISDIRAFGIDLGRSSNVASVEIAVKILDDRSGSIRATRVFSAQSPVSAAGNDAYAAALDKAFSKVLNEIVNWSLQKM